MIKETPLYHEVVCEFGFDPLSRKWLRESRLARFGSEWPLKERNFIRFGKPRPTPRRKK